MEPSLSACVFGRQTHSIGSFFENPKLDTHPSAMSVETLATALIGPGGIGSLDR
jgi:hypothetical protein